MRHSFKLFRIAGIDISVHWTFFLLVGLILLDTNQYGAKAILLGLIWLIALFFSVVVHELAHSITARHKHLPTRGIVLMVLGGISQIENIDRDPSTEFKVAIVGPLSSFALGGIGFLITKLLGGSLLPISLISFSGQSVTLTSFLAGLSWTNIFLGVFNLIPAFPMDGGRVLRSALEHFMPRAHAKRYVVGVSYAFALLMIVTGLLLGDFFLSLIGIFIFLSAPAQYSRTSNQGAIVQPIKYNSGAALVSQFITPDTRYLDAYLDAQQAAPWVLAEKRYFPVFFNGFYLGMIGPPQLAQAQPGQKVYELTIRGVPFLTPETPLVPTAVNLSLSFNGMDLPVFDKGKLVGIFRYGQGLPVTPWPITGYRYS